MRWSKAHFATIRTIHIMHAGTAEFYGLQADALLRSLSARLPSALTAYHLEPNMASWLRNGKIAWTKWIEMRSFVRCSGSKSTLPGRIPVFPIWSGASSLNGVGPPSSPLGSMANLFQRRSQIPQVPRNPRPKLFRHVHANSASNLRQPRASRAGAKRGASFRAACRSRAAYSGRTSARRRSRVRAAVALTGK